MQYLAIGADNTKLLLTLGVILVSSPALGDVIYEQNFESWSNADSMWSTNTTSSLGGAYSTVLGRFGTESASLNILATQGNSSGGSSPSTGVHEVNLKWYEQNQIRESFPDSAGGGGGGSIGGNSSNGRPINFNDLDTGGGVAGPPMFEAGTYLLHFDLMLFDSWDGNSPMWGTDSVSVAVNGVTLFNEVFHSSTSEYETIVADERPGLNAFDPQWGDSIYRDLTVTIELTQAVDRLSIDFLGVISQDIDDESWGLDNILVERLTGARSSVVPAPGVLSLLGLGGMIGSRRRR